MKDAAYRKVRGVFLCLEYNLDTTTKYLWELACLR